MKNKQRAFSLIELSIVILIIGILIAGVTQSSRLLRMAKLSTAQTLTKSSPVAGIPGLMVWFEPTLEESFLDGQSDDGVVVDQWNDINPQSSSKNYLVSTSGPNLYKTNEGPNGLPSLYFAGQMDLSNGNYAANICCKGLSIGATTAFIVYDISSADSYIQLWSENGRSAWTYQVNDGDPFVRSFYSYNAIGTDHFGLAAISSPEIASATIDASGVKVYINGVNKVNNDAPQDIRTGSGGGFWIYSLASHVSEIIIFDRALKNEERQSVEAYLGKKYGIKVTASSASSSTS
jgi:prepilin-type N-terminal cleavage/methylation domain-containing protein